MKNALFFCISLVLSVRVIAQVSGPASGQNFANTAIPGSSQSWTNLSNADVSDDKYAVFGNIPGNAGSYTDYLVITNFGFNIPSGTVVKGIGVNIERSDPNGKTADYSIRIVRAGLICPAEKSDGLSYPAADGVQVYGGPTDLWGETWSYKDIVNNNFGVAIAAQRKSPGGTTAGQIDHVTITVYYGYITLPLTLTSFTLTKENKSVLLHWQTANEADMDHVSVERSSDGSTFRSLSQVSCNNLSLSDYTYRDESPLAGTSWYRLRMRERSGNEFFSRIIPVTFSKYSLVSLSPSPWIRGSDLFVSNPANEHLVIRFYDAGGQLLGKTETSTNRVSMPVLADTKGIIYFKVEDGYKRLKGSGSLVVN